MSTSIDHLLTMPATLYHRVAQGDPDAYNDQGYVLDAGEPVMVYAEQPLRGAEEQTVGMDVARDSRYVWLRGDIEVTPTDVLDISGDRYEVDGLPDYATAPGHTHPHHVRLRIQRAI